MEGSGTQSVLERVQLFCDNLPVNRKLEIDHYDAANDAVYLPLLHGSTPLSIFYPLVLQCLSVHLDISSPQCLCYVVKEKNDNSYTDPAFDNLIYLFIREMYDLLPLNTKARGYEAVFTLDDPVKRNPIIDITLLVIYDHKYGDAVCVKCDVFDNYTLHIDCLHSNSACNHIDSTKKPEAAEKKHSMRHRGSTVSEDQKNTEDTEPKPQKNSKMLHTFRIVVVALFIAFLVLLLFTIDVVSFASSEYAKLLYKNLSE